MAKLSEHNFLFCCIIDNPLASMQVAVQQKQEVILTQLIFTIFKSEIKSLDFATVPSRRRSAPPWSSMPSSWRAASSPRPRPRTSPSGAGSCAPSPPGASQGCTRSQMTGQIKHLIISVHNSRQNHVWLSKVQI